jgi:hypothetical protein
MTTTQTAKINAIRTEALDHDDAKCVALCDAALAGDVAAAKKIGVSIKAAAAAQIAADKRPARTSAWAVPVRDANLDAEDMGIYRS